jgi:RimJ/RimL family protein N-acetyltransferase
VVEWRQWTHVENAASGRVAQRAGFRRDPARDPARDRRREINGSGGDTLAYRLTADGFQVFRG